MINKGGFKRSTEGYPEYMKKLMEVYYDAGIWRKMNWEDFLISLCKIMSKYNQKNG